MTTFVPKCSPDSVSRIACVGTGVIGGGWVAYFLARGFDVTAWDPGPNPTERLRSVVDGAWPALTERGLADGASRDRLRVAEDLGDAVRDADLVQESAPESLELKVDLLRRIDELTPPDVVISSSTSGYSMTDMSGGTTHAERLVVSHPFNPPYLIPLVEIVGGQRTDVQAISWAAAFFRGIGKSVITMDREVPGFIANRIQEALWREALHMVAAGEATVEQIDAALTEGPGMRWALHGPFMTFHLAGGQGGMAHMLDHFGPSLKSPWTRLEAPELTTELRDTVVAGCEAEADGRSVSELIAERDAVLLSVLRITDEARRRLPASLSAVRSAAADPDPA